MEIKTFKGLMADKNLTVDDITEKMKMSRSTFYLKTKNPGTFSISEVQELADILECDQLYLLELLSKEEK